MAHAFSEHIVMERVPSNGNFILALLCGLAATFVGSVAWMGITLAAGWHVSFVAIGIGILVGNAIGSCRGSNFVYGVMAMAFTLLSCLVGEIAVAIESATTPGLDFYTEMTHADLGAMASAIITHTSMMTMGVYAVGCFFAYILSIKK